MSVRYINDRFLPDKAIDLIDEAASRAKLKTYTEPDSLKKITEEIEEVKKIKTKQFICKNLKSSCIKRQTKRIKS